MKNIAKTDSTSEDADKVQDLAAYKRLKADRDAADWEQHLKYSTTTGNLKPSSYSNAASILSNSQRFASHLSYNEFTGEIVTDGHIAGENYKVNAPAGRADGSVIGDLQIILDDEWSASFSTDIVTKATLYAARQHTFNPLLDRLANARTAWQRAGSPAQLETLFVDTLGAVDDYGTRAMTRLFFDGLVTRAHEPGAKFDYMTILYSQQQGIGKTWLLSKLGGEYYTDSLLDMKSKDASQLIAQKWLVNDDELSVSTDHRANSFPVVKSFITRTTDEFRPPYTPNVEAFPRRFVLVGTTNEKGILKDATGSRRHNIITCGVNTITKPVSKLTDQDIMLYLGEAEDRYQRHACRLVATDAEQKAIEEAKGSFQVVDGTAEILETVLAALYPSSWWTKNRQEQRMWVAHILDGEDDKNTLPAVNQLDRINIAWLLDTAFKMDNTRAKTPQYERLQGALTALMDAKPDWEKPGHVIKFGREPKRGYLRVKR